MMENDWHVPAEHEWRWDEDQNGDGPLLCMNCWRTRDFSLEDEDEGECTGDSSVNPFERRMFTGADVRWWKSPL